jgi:hypothetical protein
MSGSGLFVIFFIFIFIAFHCFEPMKMKMKKTKIEGLEK